jgi:hypothetical protein
VATGHDLAEVNSQLDANIWTGAAAVIRKPPATRSPSERREAEVALTQPSATGVPASSAA